MNSTNMPIIQKIQQNMMQQNMMQQNMMQQNMMQQNMMQQNMMNLQMNNTNLQISNNIETNTPTPWENMTNTLIANLNSLKKNILQETDQKSSKKKIKIIFDTLKFFGNLVNNYNDSDNDSDDSDDSDDMKKSDSGSDDAQSKNYDRTESDYSFEISDNEAQMTEQMNARVKQLDDKQNFDMMTIDNI